MIQSIPLQIQEMAEKDIIKNVGIQNIISIWRICVCTNIIIFDIKCIFYDRLSMQY